VWQPGTRRLPPSRYDARSECDARACRLPR
jgi:hypothetical protein